MTDMSKKVGVVIFNQDFLSDDGLAALQWASVNLKQPEKVHILLVNKGAESGTDDFKSQQLSALVENITKGKTATDQEREKFDDYKKEIGTKIVSGRSYTGQDIQKILKKAINDFKLDTLVLGIAALRKTSTEGRIALRLDSECSVVLVKTTDPKPLMLTMSEIPDAPAGAGGSVPTVINDGPSKTDPKGKNKSNDKGLPSKTKPR